MLPRDFSKRRHFPGTATSFLNSITHFELAIDRFPAPVFALLLFLLALVPTLGDLSRALLLWFFFLLDWLLLALLPRAIKSFGPPKPPTLLLAILRLFPAALLFPAVLQPLSLAVQVLGTLLVLYGFWVEPHRLRVTRQTLDTPKFKPRRPLRLLHLSDLHVSYCTAREHQLVDLARSLQPDVIVITGDFLNISFLHDPDAWKNVGGILNNITAPLGVFVVTGSPAVDVPRVIKNVLDQAPVRWLREEKVTLCFEGDSFDLVGLSCTHRPFVDAPILDRVLGGKPERFTILLYHTPDLAPETALRGVDLQLSGHTHGGQVRLPLFGALYTASLYGKALEAGRYQLDGLTLYVSRGIGLEGGAAPRVRFLCPPEIILWEISHPYPAAL